MPTSQGHYQTRGTTSQIGHNFVIVATYDFSIHPRIFANMSSRQLFSCTHCGKGGFKSRNYLQQHQRSNRSCQRKQRQALGTLNPNLEPLPLNLRHEQVARRPVPGINAPFAEADVARAHLFDLDGANHDEDDGPMFSIPDDIDFGGQDITEHQDDTSWGLGDFDKDLDCQTLPAYDKPLHEFKKYVDDIANNHGVFTIYERASVKLMHLLRRKGATLDTYDEVMKWHLEEMGDKNPKHFISRTKLFKKLRTRYHLGDDYIKETQLTLPSSGTKVNIVWHDARQNVVSLLTDPRFSDEDWLHFEDDPLASPPDELQYLEDINTGLAYRETYKKLITNPQRQMLVPIVFYIDGAVTGQFDKLQVESLKMSLGILKRKTREKGYAWREQGKYHAFGLRCVLSSEL